MCGCLLAVFISYENLCFPFWLVFGLRSWVNIPMPHPLPGLQALLIFWAPTWGRQQFHAPLASDSVTITIAEAVRGAVTVPYTGLIMQMPHKTWPQLRSHFQDPTVITISSLYFFFVFFFFGFIWIFCGSSNFSFSTGCARSNNNNGSATFSISHAASISLIMTKNPPTRRPFAASI